MCDDGSGDQLREIGYKTGVFHKIICRNFFSVCIDEKGNLLKGEEADSQRQRKMQQRKIRACDAVHGAEKEIRIFEIHEQGDIGRYAANHSRLSQQFSVCPQHNLIQKIIRHDTGGNDDQIFRMKVSVKPQ